MRKLLALLIACSMLFLAQGCGKPKSTAPEAGAERPVSREEQRRELRDREKQEKREGTQNRTAPAGGTSGAARQ
jgi:hypothetical protein